MLITKINILALLVGSCFCGSLTKRDVDENIVCDYSVLEEKLDILLSIFLPNDTNTDDTSNVTSSGGGVTYNRWGRTSCPDTASLVYEGVMAKGHYTHNAGSSYLCVPLDPEFPDNTQTTGHQYGAYIYGVEYETTMNSELFNQDAPCVVCETETRSKLLMIPAKQTCPAGWTLEYDGMLMTQHYTQGASEYICVSNGMETTHSGDPDQNGGLLYQVEAVCGSLPCPPYTEGYELVCVVCTK